MARFTFVIVVLVMLVILLIGLLYLTILTHRNIHSRRDPARTAFPYFRSTLYLFLGGTLFNTITFSLMLSFLSANSDNYYRLDTAISHISIASALLNSLASCTLLLALSHLTTGLRRTASGSAYNPRKILLSITILSGIAALLWLAFFIEQQVTRARRFSGNLSGLVGFVFFILALFGFALLLVGAITVLVYAYKARKALMGPPMGAEHMSVAKQVVAMAWVNVLLLAWMIASGILGGLVLNSYFGLWTIIEVGVHHFGLFGLLWWVYWVGKKEKGGLWSGEIQ